MTNVDLCAVANLLAVLRGVKFGYSVLISFHVGILLIFDSAPDQFQDLVVEILYFLGSLREMPLSKSFLLSVFLYLLINMICV